MRLGGADGNDVMGQAYQCMIKTEVKAYSPEKGWYEDYWGNYLKWYVFDLAKILLGIAEASVYKYDLKYFF